MSERKLATVRKIAEVGLIEGADKICAYRVDGWWVVDSIDKYKVNDIVIYAEPDSWVPHSIAPFLTKAGHFPKTYNDVEGERLRTIKLQGQISQGLLLPIETAVDAFIGSKFDEGQEVGEFIQIDMDVSELLGIQKWEPPQEFRAANAKGSFPHFIPKTDQERIQNLSKQLEKWNLQEEVWQVTEKVDGSSMTVFYKDGEVGVCSRNLELKDDGSTTFWEVAKSQGLIDFLKENAMNIALQGELIGGQIQGNAYKRDKFEFYLYDIFDINKQEYLDPSTVERIAQEFNIQHVPILGYVKMDGKSIEDLLYDAEGKSQVGAKPEREGLVYKAANGSSFKAISNKWLLKTGG